MKLGQIRTYRTGLLHRQRAIRQLWRNNNWAIHFLWFQARWPGVDDRNILFTTEVYIIPEELPFAPCDGVECLGVMVWPENLGLNITYTVKSNNINDSIKLLFLDASDSTTVRLSYHIICTNVLWHYENKTSWLYSLNEFAQYQNQLSEGLDTIGLPWGFVCSGSEHSEELKGYREAVCYRIIRVLTWPLSFAYISFVVFIIPATVSVCAQKHSQSKS